MLHAWKQVRSANRLKEVVVVRQYSVVERAINEAELPLNLERGLRRGPPRELRLSSMAQHKLQLSIYCPVRRSQHQALHFFLQVRRLSLCTFRNMVDQGQRLMPPSWEQHKQEADSEGSLYRRCFTAAGLPQRQGRARKIWG